MKRYCLELSIYNDGVIVTTVVPVCDNGGLVKNIREERTDYTHYLLYFDELTQLIDML